MWPREKTIGTSNMEMEPGLEPAVPWWLNFDPYSNLSFPYPGLHPDQFYWACDLDKIQEMVGASQLQVGMYNSFEHGWFVFFLLRVPPSHSCGGKPKGKPSCLGSPESKTLVFFPLPWQNHIGSFLFAPHLKGIGLFNTRNPIPSLPARAGPVWHR